MDLADLFPTRLVPRSSRKPRFNPRDLLKVIRDEAWILVVAAEQFDILTESEFERVSLAGRRIETALGVADAR
jgi:hypothetical protein